MALAQLLPQVLFVLGIGFLVANVRAGIDMVRWIQRRQGALAVWPAAKPPFYTMSLTIGAAMGCLLLSAVFVPRPGAALFGELMMFVYYAGAVPLGTRITQGLYADGIWAESGFMPYGQIGGLRWLEGPVPTLVVASRLSALARRLPVPGPRLGEVRHLLHEKISEHAINIAGGTGLHLDGHDPRLDV